MSRITRCISLMSSLVTLGRCFDRSSLLASVAGVLAGLSKRFRRSLIFSVSFVRVAATVSGAPARPDAVVWVVAGVVVIGCHGPKAPRALTGGTVSRLTPAATAGSPGCPAAGATSVAHCEI